MFDSLLLFEEQGRSGKAEKEQWAWFWRAEFFQPSPEVW